LLESKSIKGDWKAVNLHHLADPWKTKGLEDEFQVYRSSELWMS
jgi:hypothetical protein